MPMETSEMVQDGGRKAVVAKNETGTKVNDTFGKRGLVCNGFSGAVDMCAKRKRIGLGNTSTVLKFVSVGVLGEG